MNSPGRGPAGLGQRARARAGPQLRRGREGGWCLPAQLAPYPSAQLLLGSTLRCTSNSASGLSASKGLGGWVVWIGLDWEEWVGKEE